MIVPTPKALFKVVSSHIPRRPQIADEYEVMYPGCDSSKTYVATTLSNHISAVPDYSVVLIVPEGWLYPQEPLRISGQGEVGKSGDWGFLIEERRPRGDHPIR